jgi:hypothetical protein
VTTDSLSATSSRASSPATTTAADAIYPSLHNQQPLPHSISYTSSLANTVTNKKYFIIDNDALNSRTLLDYLNSVDQNDNNNNDTTDTYHLNSTVNILNSKVRAISKKHLTNILANGYEAHHTVHMHQAVDLPTSIGNGSTKTTNLSGRVKNQASKFFYIINKNMLNENSQIKKPTKFNHKNDPALLQTNYLSLLYIFIKFMYLVMLLAQGFFLNKILNGNPIITSTASSSTKPLVKNINRTVSHIAAEQATIFNQNRHHNYEFYMIGVNLVKSFVYETEWPHLSIFPRMTLCEIYIREVGTVHPYLIQCVLRINIFNELIFILVWHWLLFVTLLTAGDLIKRVIGYILLCSTCQRKLFALKYLELIHLNQKTVDLLPTAEEQSLLKNDSFLFVIESDKAKRGERRRQRGAAREHEFSLFERFCELNFNNDTVFALRLVERNASSLIVSEIVEHLWLKFKYLNLVHSTEASDFVMKRLLVLKKVSDLRENSLRVDDERVAGSSIEEKIMDEGEVGMAGRNTLIRRKRVHINEDENRLN